MGLFIINVFVGCLLSQYFPYRQILRKDLSNFMLILNEIVLLLKKKMTKLVHKQRVMWMSIMDYGLMFVGGRICWNSYRILLFYASIYHKGELNAVREIAQGHSSQRTRYCPFWFSFGGPKSTLADPQSHLSLRPC